MLYKFVQPQVVLLPLRTWISCSADRTMLSHPAIQHTQKVCRIYQSHVGLLIWNKHLLLGQTACSPEHLAALQEEHPTLHCVVAVQ